jgi:hypothetical protein
MTRDEKARAVWAAILSDLTDRKGIRHAFDNIDDDVMEEIASINIETVRLALAAADATAREEENRACEEVALSTQQHMAGSFNRHTKSATVADPFGRERPCNGCGLCCKQRPCALARSLAGVFEGPCPCLEKEDGRWWCGLVRNPHKHIPGLASKPWGDEALAPMIHQALGIGRSCDAEC